MLMKVADWQMAGLPKEGSRANGGDYRREGRGQTMVTTQRRGEGNRLPLPKGGVRQMAEATGDD